MYVLGSYTNNFVFGKILSGIEKAVKIFSILNKIFFKNNILLCVLKSYDSKILLIIRWKSNYGILICTNHKFTTCHLSNRGKDG